MRELLEESRTVDSRLALAQIGAISTVRDAGARAVGIQYRLKRVDAARDESGDGSQIVQAIAVDQRFAMSGG